MVTATLTVPIKGSAQVRSFYRPELDALRFFAFLAVFLFHFNRPVDLFVQHGIPRVIAQAATGLIETGVFGVDLFFVLSAYLITELLTREKETTGSLDVRGFYLRRILRIWPLYFVYIGLALIPVFNPNHALSWRQAVAFALLAGNWSIIVWGWPLNSIIVPLWTVSIEEQFYLLWPPIVRKLSRTHLGVAGIFMLFISTVTRIIMVAVHGGVNSVWCNTLSRLDPIAAGVIIAAVLRGGVPKVGGYLRFALLIAGIAPMIFVANVWKIHEPQQLDWTPTLIGFPLVALGCSCILVAILGIEFNIPRSLLYVGKISYGLYVFHRLGNVLSGMLIPIHAAFLQLALRPLLALAITLALATISYEVLEKPFLKLKNRFAHIASRPV
jgi:peptidoglycan/LPS O-acetylase OafA/YrhL